MNTNADHEFEIEVSGETRRVKQYGDVFKYGNGSYYETFSFMELTIEARRGKLPEWVSQIPGLVERIEAVFAKERELGIEPHTRFAKGDGKITAIDLRHGTTVSGNIQAIKQRFAETGVLPRAFSSARARELLGVAS